MSQYRNFRVAATLLPLVAGLVNKASPEVCERDAFESFCTQLAPEPADGNDREVERHQLYAAIASVGSGGGSGFQPMRQQTPWSFFDQPVDTSWIEQDVRRRNRNWLLIASAG